MATSYRILGQLESAAATLETLYTVPGSTSTVLSSINICNRTSASKAVRIAIRQNGAIISNQQYIAYDLAIAANDSVALSLGVTLSAGDVVSVYASSASSVSWNLFGSEIS